jgi:hypothetical protein
MRNSAGMSNSVIPESYRRRWQERAEQIDLSSGLISKLSWARQESKRLLQAAKNLKAIGWTWGEYRRAAREL